MSKKIGKNIQTTEDELVELLERLAIERREIREEYKRRDRSLLNLTIRTEEVLQSRGRTSAGETTIARRQTEEEQEDADFEIGDYVIITSRTGGLRNTRARIIDIKTASYLLSIKGKKKPVLRRKGSVRRPNRNGL